MKLIQERYIRLFRQGRNMASVGRLAYFSRKYTDFHPAFSTCLAGPLPKSAMLTSRRSLVRYLSRSPRSESRGYIPYISIGLVHSHQRGFNFYSYHLWYIHFSIGQLSWLKFTPSESLLPTFFHSSQVCFPRSLCTRYEPSIFTPLNWTTLPAFHGDLFLNLMADLLSQYKIHLWCCWEECFL